jgi:NAD(P)-dependent dehydrogenase (short-subunit alcohol dehydrogenase family)
MPKSMLISGASTGIGKALSLELDRQGYRVFAGVRNSNDADVLRSQASPQLTPVILDVTIPETISTTCRELSDKTGGELFCLVNNAGISISGALEFMPLQDFRQQMEVNLVGQLALTQACLPMLRRAAGRVVFVSSVSGRLATPFNGPYAASKAALVALADALRIELFPWGIPVSVLIVGSVQTPIWEKSSHTAVEILRRLPAEAWNLYGKMQKRAGVYYTHTGRSGMPVEKLVKITRSIFKANRPKEYMLVGRDAVIIELIAKLLPVRLRDWLVRWQMDLLKP